LAGHYVLSNHIHKRSNAFRNAVQMVVS